MRITILLLSFSFVACERSIDLGETNFSGFADLDGDQREDVISTSVTSEFLTGSVEFRLSTNEFEGPQAFSFPGFQAMTDAGDLDADGDLDFVVVDSDQFRTLINQGDGTLLEGAPITSQGVFPSFFTASLIDVDGDSFLDLVINSNGLIDSFYSIDLATGVIDATPQAPPPDDCSVDICIDIDGDGDRDELSTLVARINQGDDLTFVEQPLSFVEALATVNNFLQVADLDADSDLDLVVTSQGFEEVGGSLFTKGTDSFAISFSLNNGGTFGAFDLVIEKSFTSGNVLGLGDGFVSLDISDLEQDGASELLIWDGSRAVDVFDARQGDFVSKLRVGRADNFRIAALSAPGVQDLVVFKKGKLIIKKL